MSLFVIFGIGLLNTAFGLPTMNSDKVAYSFPFISRNQWNARMPTDTIPLSTPVPYVVIHHTYVPAACYNVEKCSAAMRSMQDFHMDGHKWADIGYNYCVGSDGSALEGRGFTTLGAHALNFNSVSIGICLIGDWSTATPPPEQIKTAKALIAAGVELGYIKKNYKLIGHRQVRTTSCPGDGLFNNIQEWDHYSKFPNSVKDLINVEELPEKVKMTLRPS